MNIKQITQIHAAVSTAWLVFVIANIGKAYKEGILILSSRKFTKCAINAFLDNHRFKHTGIKVFKT
jgi:hypothetical protein